MRRVSAGVAPEHAVLATCRDILLRGKKAVVRETAITVTTRDVEQAETAWRDLAADGLVGIERLPDLGD